MQRGYFASAEKTAGSGKMSRLENGKTKNGQADHRRSITGWGSVVVLPLPTLQKGRVRARKDRWIMYDIFEKLKSLNTAPTVTGTPEFLVVGLGNPEPEV